MRIVRYLPLITVVGLLWDIADRTTAAEETATAWRHDFAQAWAEAQTSGKPLLLHFYADWCGPCRQMESQVLNTPETLKQLAQSFVAVKVNSDDNPDLVRKFNIRALPSDVFIDSDGRVLSHSEGFTDRGEYIAKLGRIEASVAQSRKIQIARDEQAKPADGGEPATIAQGKPLDDGAVNGEPAAGEVTSVVGLDGYSPVALTSSRQWVKGNKQFAFVHQGIEYWMASAGELEQFQAAPAQFSPRLLGCDPVLLWKSDKAIAGSTQFGAFFDGELFLFTSEDSREQFKKDPLRYTRTRHVLKLDEIETTRLR